MSHMSKDNASNMNNQDSPHREGAYGNTAAQKPGGENVSAGMSDIGQESAEQQKGREGATESDKMSRDDNRESANRQGNSSI